MVTRAIVEEVITPFQIKIRIPTLDRVSTHASKNASSLLNTAVICTTPRCDINLRPGDIVFVTFEDGSFEQAVILGTLYKESLSKAIPSQILSSLAVEGKTTLSPLTTIGAVTPVALSCLEGCTTNIQQEFNKLNMTIQELQTELQKKLNGGTS